MQLKDFCQNYPPNAAEWPLVRPSRAIPVYWREILFAKLGYVLSANDRSRNRSSSRLGVSLRPFQAGDRLGAISLTHLMRTNELLSRVDESRGQLQVRIFLIIHPSLDFRSGVSTCTKGQIALGVAGVLDAVHSRQNQAVRITYCTRHELESHLRTRIRSRAETYIISDFLDNSLASDLDIFKKHGIIQASYFCVRDPIEAPGKGNPLLDDVTELQAFVGDDQMRRFSGRLYGENLSREIAQYRALCRDARSSFQLFTENDELHRVVRAMTEAYSLGS